MHARLIVVRILLRVLNNLGPYRCVLSSEAYRLPPTAASVRRRAQGVGFGAAGSSFQVFRFWV